MFVTGRGRRQDNGVVSGRRQRADIVATKLRVHEPGCLQEQPRESNGALGRTGVASPGAATAPGFEAVDIAQLTVVDQRRDGSMMERREALAPSCPTRLFSHAARYRHDQLHGPARRKITNGAIGRNEESIGNELHRLLSAFERDVQDRRPAMARAETPAASQKAQFFRIE